MAGSSSNSGRHNKSNFIHSRCRSFACSLSLILCILPSDKHSPLVLGTTLWARVFISLFQDSVYWCITNIVIVVASSSFSLFRCYYYFCRHAKFYVVPLCRCTTKRIRWLFLLRCCCCCLLHFVQRLLNYSSFGSSLLALSISISPCTKRRDKHHKEISNVLYFSSYYCNIPFPCTHTHRETETDTNSFSARRSFCFYNNNNLL